MCALFREMCYSHPILLDLRDSWGKSSWDFCSAVSSSYYKIVPSHCKTEKEDRKKNRAKAIHTWQKFASQLSFGSPKGGFPFVYSISEGKHFVGYVLLKINNLSWHRHCRGQNVKPESISFHFRFLNENM